MDNSKKIILKMEFSGDNAGLNHTQLMSSIKLIGNKVIPLVEKMLDK